MKRLIIIFLLASNVCTAQTFANDTTLTDGTYDAGGKAMYITAKIGGNVTINNAIIIAPNPFIQIFDTTVILGTGIKCERFSAMWYGANPSLTDNSRQLQYAINACINKSWQLYIPSGVYKTKDSLIVKTGEYGNYGQSTIHMYGDAAFWGDGGSQILYSGDFCALGLQNNKGSTIRNIILTGKWKSPTTSGVTYYSTGINDFTNTGTGGNGNGLWIDPFGNWNQRGGSTGCKFTDMQIGNFMTDIKISNSISQNGEIMIFENIQLKDAKYGVLTSQPQEKGNVFRGVYSWGKIHTLFKINNGNYYIDGANIAGSCIRLFDISNQSWFPTHIQNIYAENIGTIGNFSTYLPLAVNNSVFDFAYQNIAGVQTLLTSNKTSNLIKFDNCQFRYYGSSDDFKFSGTAKFENCLFTSTINGISPDMYIRYANGGMDYNPPAVSIDTIPVMKLTLRKSNRQ